MLTSLAIIFPVIAVIALGYGAVRLRVFTRRENRALNRFVFMIAAPALLFRNVAQTDMPEIMPWGLWLSYFIAMFACVGLGAGLSWVVRRHASAKAHLIVGFGSGFSNTVMLGIPIILTAFGDGAAIPLFLILAFHGLLIFSVTGIGLEIAERGTISWGEAVRMVGGLLRDQQVMLALLAGVVWNFTGLGLAAPIDRFLQLIGGAAIPVALIAVGGTLAHVQMRASVAAAMHISAIKLVVHPFLVYALASYVFALPPLWVATATVLAAMPSGVFTSVFANRYNAATDIAASAIMLSTLLSALSTALWLGFFAGQLAH